MQSGPEPNGHGTNDQRPNPSTMILPMAVPATDYLRPNCSAGRTHATLNNAVVLIRGGETVSDA